MGFSSPLELDMSMRTGPNITPVGPFDTIPNIVKMIGTWNGSLIIQPSGDEKIGDPVFVDCSVSITIESPTDPHGFGSTFYDHKQVSASFSLAGQTLINIPARSGSFAQEVHTASFRKLVRIGDSVPIAWRLSIDADVMDQYVGLPGGSQAKAGQYAEYWFDHVAGRIHPTISITPANDFKAVSLTYDGTLGAKANFNALQATGTSAASPFVDVYWAKGPLENDIIDRENPVFYGRQLLTAGANSVQIAAANLRDPPKDAKYLAMIVDSFEVIDEADETNNFKSIQLPPRIEVTTGPDDDPSTTNRATGTTTFFIGTNKENQVHMPSLTFEIVNLPAVAPPSVVHWTITIDYGPSENAPRGARPVPGFVIKQDGPAKLTLQSFSPANLTTWNSIRGGHLKVTAVFWKKYLSTEADPLSTEPAPPTKLQILGTNPTPEQFIAFVNNKLTPPSNWKLDAQSFRTLVKKIAWQESGGIRLQGNNKNVWHQFYDTGKHPIWNTGGDGGVGVMQITIKDGNDVLKIEPEDVWNWQHNIKTAVAILNSKLKSAADYASNTRAYRPSETSPKLFEVALAKFNFAHKKEFEEKHIPMLKPGDVVVPQLGPWQQVLFAVRYYNGAKNFAGMKDSIGRPFRHEYELLVDANGGLVLKQNAQSKIWSAEWLRGENPVLRKAPPGVKQLGEPDYVKKVLDAVGMPSDPFDGTPLP